MGNKKVRRKLNKKALLVILLTLYLIIMAFYYVFTLPIRNINIVGNNLPPTPTGWRTCRSGRTRTARAMKYTKLSALNAMVIAGERGCAMQ